MEYYYTIDNKNKMICITYTGKMNIVDLNNTHLTIVKDENFNPDYNILNDARKCRFDFDPEELQKHTDLIKKEIGTITVKSAIVVETPYETAAAMFFQDMAKGLRRVRIFSTIEAARLWLKSSI